MIDFPWEVLILGAVLAANRFVVAGSTHRPTIFWTLQAINAALAVATLVFGLPGLSAYPVVSWMVAALLGFHLFQNFALRSAAVAAERRGANDRAQFAKLRESERGEP